VSVPDPRRIVVLAPNWLGDVVMALPALADVRRQFRAATLAVAARSGLAPIYDAVPGVDDVVPLAGGLVQRSDIRALRRKAFDAALLFPNSFHAAWLAWRARVPERWGYRRDARGPLLTRSIRAPRTKRLHQAEYYQALTAALGVVPGPLHPTLVLTDRMRTTGDQALRAAGWTGEPLVGLAPGAAYGTAKQWPPGRMGALAAQLAHDAARPVIVGAAEDVETAREVVASAERAGAPVGHVINLAGRTTLTALPGVLARCSAFVSNDSGAMHLAAAIGVPVTAIFGPTRERATSPVPAPGAPAPSILTADVFCRPCMLRTCPIDHRCMTRIGVPEVLASVQRQLGGRGAAA
jgi:heptosyltransferase-2